MNKTAAVILAGGLSSRMGGGDKWLLELGTQRLVDRVIERITPQVDGVVVNANGDAGRSDLGTLPVVPDSIEGFAGPLAGVLAGMDWAADNGFQSLISVAADTPFFPEDLAEKLQTGAQMKKLPLAMAVTYGDADRDGFSRHPTFGLWDVSLRNDLRKALNEGVRKVVQWTSAKGCANVVFDVQEFDPFFNVNRPEDMARAELMIKEYGL